jgi:subtilisin family serine protease
MGDRLPQPEIRQKPDIVAPDGTNTTFFGRDIAGDLDAFPNFFGTSAAAPHASAVAALLKQVDPGLTPGQVYILLQESTIDMDDPRTPGFDVGFDLATGFGLIQADEALERLFNQSNSTLPNSSPSESDPAINDLGPEEATESTTSQLDKPFADIKTPLIGTFTDDFIRGSNNDDVIHGGRGNDQLIGEGNNDKLHGVEGDDLLRGNLGRDRLLGGPGDDRLFGGGGNDFFKGGKDICIHRVQKERCCQDSFGYSHIIRPFATPLFSGFAEESHSTPNSCENFAIAPTTIVPAPQDSFG